MDLSEWKGPRTGSVSPEYSLGTPSLQPLLGAGASQLRSSPPPPQMAPGTRPPRSASAAPPSSRFKGASLPPEKGAEVPRTPGPGPHRTGRPTPGGDEEGGQGPFRDLPVCQEVIRSPPGPSPRRLPFSLLLPAPLPRFPPGPALGSRPSSVCHPGPADPRRCPRSRIGPGGKRRR